jgi:putative autoinducer-2 (AI-2) aldolase
MADIDGMDVPAQRVTRKRAAKATTDMKGVHAELPPFAGDTVRSQQPRGASAPRKEGFIMDWGLANRLSRIIRPDTGRTVMLAVDHGYFLGPTTGLEDPFPVIEPLLPFADALMPTRGVLRTCVDPWQATDTAIVLRVSGTNSILTELSNEDLTVSMDDALRLNVSGVALSVYVGSEYQEQTLKNLADLVDEGVRYGMPVLAVTAVGKDMARDVRYLSLACRIAAEIGAHLVKTYYCEGFERVVNTCPVPIVMAGGKKLPEDEALTLTHNAVKRGAAGVDMGRNIFQSDDPVAMIQAVRAVVHDDLSPKKAYEMFLELMNAGKKARARAAGRTGKKKK